MAVNGWTCGACGGIWLEEAPHDSPHGSSSHFWGNHYIGAMHWIFMGAEHTRTSRYTIAVNNVRVNEWLYPQIGDLYFLEEEDPDREDWYPPNGSA